MIKTVWILVFGGMCSSLFAQALSPKVSRGMDATSCETNTLNLDLIADKFVKGQLKDEFVILISRPGKNERLYANVHTRRLHTITSYLERRTNRQLQMITAVGSRTGELGRVEMYVQGKLFAVSAARCEDIPVGICDDKNADPQYYLNGRFRRKCR